MALLLYKFFLHQPFDLTKILSLLLPENFSLFPPVPVVADYATGLFWAVCLLLSALFVGRLVLSRIFKNPASSLEIIVLSAGLGYGLLSYLTLGLAALGFLDRWIFKVGVILMALGCVISFLRPAEKPLLASAWKEQNEILFSTGVRFYLSFLLGFIFLTDFVMAFVPELFYDALVYHLGVPNFYLSAGKLAPLDVMHSKFPFTVQMIYLIGLALKDEMVTKLTHFFTLALISGGMLAFGIRYKKTLWGLVGALIFAATPTVQLNVISSGVDVAGSLFAFLGAYALLISFESGENSRKLLALSGLFVGFALGSKYTAAPVAATLGTVFVVRSFLQKKPIVEILKDAFTLGGIAAVVVAPWLIKDWMETGNPIFPFLSDFFGGTRIAPWRYDMLRGENYGVALNSVKDFLVVYWKLAITERSSLSFQGPLLLGLLPFCVYGLLKERTSSTKTLLWMSGLFLLGALFMTRLTRYWMPGLTFATLGLSLGVAVLLEEKSYFKKTIILFLVSLGILYQMSWVYFIIHSSYEPQNVLLGRVSRDSYISTYHPGMNPNPSIVMYRYMETVFGKEDKVLLVGEEQAFPIRVKHSYSGVFDKGTMVKAADTSQSPEEMHQKLVDAGFTHLMVNLYESHRLGGYGIYDFTPAGFAVFCGFWEDYLEMQHMEQAPLVQGYTNPILLLKIRPDRRPPDVRPVENVVVQFFEKFELPRIGIDSPEKMINFYTSLMQKWPQVGTFRSRLQDLEKR